MATEEENIDFHHPFTPYAVQDEFMQAVYSVLAEGQGQVGILESPTGTGKSLSLICAALTWLRRHKSSAHEATLASSADRFREEPPWLVEQLLKRERDDLARRWEEREARLEKIRAKEKAQERRGAKRRKIDEGPGAGPSSKSGRPVDEEAEWLLDDGDERDMNDPLSGLSAETREVLSRIGLAGPRKRDDAEDDKLEDEIKIYYASRTHSQLNQFISELRRPSFPPSFPKDMKSKREDGANQETELVKHLPLSSRQKLCINPSVSRLGSLSAINDRCAELQQSKTKGGKCQFLPNDESVAQTHQFRDTALATLPDIEDLHTLGKSLSICPYYASRTALPGAEIVTLPYPLLLQPIAREALGIRLDGNIVIIDEAHNIMDAVAGANAAAIRLGELRRARQMLAVYVKRFGKRLKGENRAMVARVARVVESLSDWLTDAVGKKPDQGIVDSAALLRHKSIDQINMFELIKYIQASKLAYKIESYVSHVEEQIALADQASASASSTGGSVPARSSPSTPVLHKLVSFLLALTNLSFEGRIFFQKLEASGGRGADIELSYLLLSPTHAFSSIADKARAVILAGGTMSPFEDYTAHLFPTYAPSKITTLSCGHVIPPSSLCVWTLAKTKATGPAAGAGGEITFEFSFQRRGDRAMVNQLGLVLLNVCSVVPDGVVVFFPSYGYLDEVVQAWQTKAGGSKEPSIWDRLGNKKAVFREAKGGSSDEVLEAYSAAILGDASTSASSNAAAPPPGANLSKGGAILLSVVGGKMSEGINFSDRLGRCVVVVGLPYPNMHSPEWRAKTEYVESTTLSRLLAPPPADASGGGGLSSGKGARDEVAAAARAKQAARDFYENACMRAVNQSIGRAIRHKGDYASIILVDRRYGTDRIRAKLPGWIKGGLVSDSHDKGLPPLMGALSAFFRSKKGV